MGGGNSVVGGHSQSFSSSSFYKADQCAGLYNVLLWPVVFGGLCVWTEDNIQLDQDMSTELQVYRIFSNIAHYVLVGLLISAEIK